MRKFAIFLHYPCPRKEGQVYSVLRTILRKGFILDSWHFFLDGYSYATIIFVDLGGLLIMQVDKAGNVIISHLHNNARTFDNPLQ
jgi:hypothetical protein